MGWFTEFGEGRHTILIMAALVYVASEVRASLEIWLSGSSCCRKAFAGKNRPTLICLPKSRRSIEKQQTTVSAESKEQRPPQRIQTRRERIMNQRLRRIFILLLLSIFIYFHLSLRKELHNAQDTIKQLQRTIEPLMKSLSRCHHHHATS